MFKLTTTVFSAICFTGLCRFSVSQDFTESYFVCNVTEFFGDPRHINLTCPESSEILLKEALYGVPNINNGLADNPCNISSSDDECLVEFTQELNRWCSGRQYCSIKMNVFPNWWAVGACIFDPQWKNQSKLVYVRYACVPVDNISRCTAGGQVENHHMNLSHTSGYLQSPNYPDPYPQGEYNCLWWVTMTESDATTGILFVYHFELENNDNSKCDNSYLQINNNNEKYCDNKTLDGLSFDGGDTFTVEFVVTESSGIFSTANERRGFFIHYQVTPVMETTEAATETMLSTEEAASAETTLLTDETGSAETTTYTPTETESRESSTEIDNTISTMETSASTDTESTEQTTEAADEQMPVAVSLTLGVLIGVFLSVVVFAVTYKMKLCCFKNLLSNNTGHPQQRSHEENDYYVMQDQSSSNNNYSFVSRPADGSSVANPSAFYEEPDQNPSLKSTSVHLYANVS